MRGRRVLAFVAVFAGLPLVLPATAAAQRERSNLTVLHVAVGGVLQAGGQAAVTALVSNTGASPAGRSQAVVLLSKDAVRSSGDTVLGRVATGPVGPKAAGIVQARVRLPATLRPGRHRVLVCADSRRTIHESREGDNCRATRNRVEVVEPLPEPWVVQSIQYHDTVLAELIWKGMESDPLAAEALNESYAWMSSVALIPSAPAELRFRADAMPERMAALVMAGLQRNLDKCESEDLNAVRMILDYARTSVQLGLKLEKQAGRILSACVALRYT
ncbi:MAG: hypothetical protein JHC95_00250 [Solirubrobacteraceae bacterium]|nr:hypothetical protein [Solirubrobacteraceae bacterium]